MKIFMKVLFGLALVVGGVLFFMSGKSARDEKYTKEVILANKGENNLENNQKESFVADLFAYNNLIYKKEKVGNIIFNETVLINDKESLVYINIDVYQVMGFYTDDILKTFFNGVLNEFSIDGKTGPLLTVTGSYEDPLAYEVNTQSFTIKNFNFPIFGLNDTVTSGKRNKLESVVFRLGKIEFFELVVNKSTTELETKINLKDLPNYPTDETKMYEEVLETLDVSVGRLIFPTKEQTEKLNELGYNFKIFEGQEKYNYLITIYVVVYLILASVIVYFVYLKSYFNKKKTNR